MLRKNKIDLKSKVIVVLDMLVGVVGKPSVGKSTFFKAITLAEVEIASYPFTTIKPNTGVGYVKVKCVDSEFNVKCMPRDGFCVDGFRFVPVQMMDVAGLIEGAHEGKGMGNQFLDDLRQADVFIHVVDIAGSTNEKGEIVAAGSYDPANDVRFLEVELDMWYYGIFKRAWEKFVRLAVQEGSELKKAIVKHYSGLGGVNEELVDKLLNELKLKNKKLTEWEDEDVKLFASTLRKRTKPMIIAANKIDVEGAYSNFLRLQREFKEYVMVACSAESELALREAAKQGLIEYVPGEKEFKIVKKEKLSERQLKALEFIKKNILEKYGSTGVQKVLDVAVFDYLKYVAVFPGGVNNLVDSKGRVLPDCYLMPPNSTALDFAFRIHTDIGKKFIRAIDVKTKRTVGKEHLLKHRDVVEIVTAK